jgi:hypothetical protein
MGCSVTPSTSTRQGFKAGSKVHVVSWPRSKVRSRLDQIGTDFIRTIVTIRTAAHSIGLRQLRQ